MSNMTNIVVKNASGTDVTYEVVNRAGPDGSFAIWADMTNPIPLLRPTFKVATKPNGPGTARRVTIEYRHPVVTALPDNEYIVRDTILHGSSGSVIPLRVTEEVVENAAIIFTNLCASTQVREILTTGNSLV